MITITKSDTPETDALFMRECFKMHSQYPVVKLCKEIERDRDKLKDRHRILSVRNAVIESEIKELDASLNSIFNILQFLNHG